MKKKDPHERPWSEALAPELEEALLGNATAQELLRGLTGAFFPGGGELGEMRRLTWSEGQVGKTAAGDLSTEARLRAAEARFRTLVEQIPAVTFMAVLGEGENEIYVSPHIEQLLGFTQREWLEDPFLWYTQLHFEDRRVWNEEFARGCRTGGPFRAECRFLARDGRVVWVHGEARVVRDEAGRPQFLQGVAFDISDIKAAQDVLVREAVSRAKLEEELAIARRVQTSIVPRRFAVPGLDIAARMQPAEQVGGDYYDVMPFPGGCWLAIGDVSGHGLDSGLIMLMMQSALSGLVRACPDAPPSELHSRLNEVLHDNIRERLRQDHHVTFTLLRYSDDGRVVFTGAHEDILVVRRGGPVEVVRPEGTWLGIRRDIRGVQDDATLRLEPGDMLVLYTDGLTEARSAGREMFELERMIRCVEGVHAASAAAVCEAVFRAVQAFMTSQHDDMTVMAVRRIGPDAATDGGER